jgi:glutathione S-transferase
MQRLLILVVVLYVVWRVLYVRGRRLARARVAREEEYLSRLWAHGRDWSAGERPTLADDELVTCGRCGISVPSRRLQSHADGRRLCEACSGSASGEQAGHDAAG